MGGQFYSEHRRKAAAFPKRCGWATTVHPLAIEAETAETRGLVIKEFPLLSVLKSHIEIGEH